MLEKRLYAVSPQLITANGSANGYINVANACDLFKVKQRVSVTDALGSFKELEIKRIDEPNKVYLGPVGTPIGVYSDMSAYTTANGSFIFADEQQRPKVPEEQIPRAVYEEEPTVAIRSILVDECGAKISDANPLPVSATFSGSFSKIPTIYNLPIVNASQEYSYIFPASTKQFSVKDRAGDAKLKISFIAGDTSSNFKTLDYGCTYEVGNMLTNLGFAIYIQSSKPSRFIEIVSWS